MYDDFFERIIEPDIFLPSQFYGTGGLSRKLEAETRPMTAIFKDAVGCFDKYRGSSSSAGRSHYDSAIEWVKDTDTDWLFSFTNICTLLEFDPDYMREGLLKRENKYSKPVRPSMLTFAAMGSRQ